MKPVFPNESKYSRALFAAQLRLKGTMLTADAEREICEELVRLAGELLKKPDVTQIPPTIEPGQKCPHGRDWTTRWRDCLKCVQGGGG